MKFVCTLIVAFLSILQMGSASVHDEAAKRVYAQKFHDAFILQSRGKPYTTTAYYLFKDAFVLAREAGVSARKLQVLNELFIWYRKYGYSLGLMAKYSGCIDESRGGYHGYYAERYQDSENDFMLPFSNLPDYQSEFGKTPQEAAQIRDFLFGVGEVISGILCIYVGSLPVKPVGVTLTIEGCHRMWNAANRLYAQYEDALYQESLDRFKKWELKARSASE